MPTNSREIDRWLREYISSTWQLAAAELDGNAPFSRFGIDSLAGQQLVAALSAWLGVKLRPTLLWEYSTIGALSGYLGAEPKTIHRSAPELPVSKEEEPIALVGMACRFPGASQPSAFWQFLCRGGDACVDIPSQRWGPDFRQEIAARLGGRQLPQRAAFLDRVDLFDPLFFGISPREAQHMDPQQRLMLELAWEAMEDAGIPAQRLQGSRTGVFFGAMWSDYALLLHERGLPALAQHSATGIHHSIIANRVSYVLGLQGPSLVVHTACSSSLVALHLACESIHRGESVIAFAGGVNLNILPDSTVSGVRFGGLSPDGRCYTFDARANGFSRGEGAGVVLLKPLAQALADNDRIYCLIRGSAVNNDGASNGLTAPSRFAQEAVLRRAYAQAEIAPSAVDYVELHGTGTPLGDPIEASALAAVCGEGRAAGQPLAVGSVKTNIGHLDAAAGVAGLIKTALCIWHRELPPSLHFAQLNPAIPAELPLAVQCTRAPWPSRRRAATAGVSSFGFGGTNAHAVLQELLPPAPSLLALAAEEESQLRERVREVLSTVEGSKSPLPALCQEVPSPRPGQAFRMAALAHSKEALQSQLRHFLAGEPAPGLWFPPARRPSVGDEGPVFVFSGQGSQWLGMGRALLLSEPVFREELERCSRLVQEYAGWSLGRKLLLVKSDEHLADVAFSLPAIVGIQIALAAQLRAWGISPAAVVGHSIGEVAAAYVAGVLSLEAAMRVICTPGPVVQPLRGRGGMGLVGLSWEAAGEAIAAHSEVLYRVIHNAPHSTVLGGDPGALSQVMQEVAQRGVFCQAIKIDIAAHSPQLDPVRDALRAGMGTIQPRAATIPYFSSVTGSLEKGTGCDTEYWVRNLVEHVRFAEAIAEAARAGYRLFAELSPHPIVQRAIADNLQAAGIAGAVRGSLRRDEDDRGALLELLAVLHTHGLSIARVPTPPDSLVGDQVHVLPLSARSPQALTELSDRYAELLSAPDSPPLSAIAYSAGVRRSHHEHRLAIVAATKKECLDALRSSSERPLDAASGRSKLVFVFPGQGSQWIGMGRELLRAEPVFRDVLMECEAEIQQETGWSLLAELHAEPAASRLQQIGVVQPVLTALQLALAALLRSWGVEPDAVVGHSMGEVAAAQVCGSIRLPDAIRIICRRSRLMQRLAGRGAMAVLDSTRVEAEGLIAALGDRLAIAASNGPHSTVIAGEPEALARVLQAQEALGKFGRRIAVDVASHSPQMEELRADFLAALPEISSAQPRLAMYSTVTGNLVGAGELDRQYWFRNLRDPVRFGPTIERLEREGHTVFVEISPHPILTPVLEFRTAGQSALATLRREQPERQALLTTLAALYMRGCDIAWSRLHPSGSPYAALPSYPWQRQRYWLEDAAAMPAPRSPPDVRGAGSGHPLLGEPFSVAMQPAAHFWQQKLSVATAPLVAEHRVFDQAVFPAAGFIEMAWAAARQALGLRAVGLAALTFDRMLSGLEGASLLTQTAIARDADGHLRCQISVQEQGQWMLHASAQLIVNGITHGITNDITAPESAPAEPLEDVRRRCPLQRTGEALYQDIAARGISYGPSFRGVSQLWMGEGEVLARVVMTDEVAAQASQYQVHPAWLDSCFHACFAAAPELTSGVFIPTALGQITFHRPPSGASWVHVRSQRQGSALLLDLVVRSESGLPILEIRQLQAKHVPAGSGAERVDQANALFETRWLRRDLPALGPRGSTAPGKWLIFADRLGIGEALAQALRQPGGLPVVVRPAAAYQRQEGGACTLDPVQAAEYSQLLRAEFAPGERCLGVIHLWSLDATPSDRASLRSLDADQQTGSLSLLALAQALLQAGWPELPPLWLVTQGTQAVVPQERTSGISQAPLWGLGKTLLREYPSLRSSLIDLGANPTLADLPYLMREVLAESGEEQVALRDGERYVGRLAPVSLQPSLAPLSSILHADGSYLVTGGLGGLGLAAAEVLAASGAKQLVLVGRNPPGPQAQAAISRMQGLGAGVIAAQVDVASEQEVAALVSKFGRQWPALRGILHAAGLLDDGLVTELSSERFQAVMAPKIKGAWNLHALTLDQPLDFFVLYSSAASLLGSPGQANYAAANSFLDSLAHHRRGRGLCGTSINWGPFVQVGMLAERTSVGDRFSAQGITPFTVAEGSAIWPRLLLAAPTQVGALRLSPSKWLASFPELRKSSYWELLSANEQPASGQVDSQAVPFIQRVWQAPPEERQPLIERRLFEHLARILRLPDTQIDPQRTLLRLGLDSLMALELRNRLATDLQLQVPTTLLLQDTRIAQLAAYLHSQIAKGREDEEAAAEITEGEL